MRLLPPTVLALSILFPAAVTAQGTLNKCIDAHGGVTYSNLPCRNAREVRTLEIDPAPTPEPVRPATARTPPAAPVSSPSTRTEKPATLKLETRQTSGNSVTRGSANRCDALTDKIGKVFDKMDQARRQGYTQEQMNQWNQEVKELERSKQQSGCF